MSDDGFSGRIEPVPLSPPDGQKLSLDYIGFDVTLSEGLHRVDLSALDGAVLAIQLSGDVRTVFVGSAVVVAPGIALTAAHVVDEMAAQRAADPALLPEGVGLHPDRKLTVWLVRMTYTIPNTDLALLMLEPRTNVYARGKILAANTTARLPYVGEKVCAVGFRGQAEATATKYRAEVLADFYVSVGTVSEVFPDGRDSVMMPGPCFCAELQTEGGMSGGAVFNSMGEVVGINSTSYPVPSYPSIIAPALFRRVKPTFPESFYGNADTAIAVLSGASSRISGLSDIRLQLRDDGSPYCVWGPAS